MDLTPRLLTEVEFREQWRGYSPNDVDDFLERVAAALGELQERLREATERAGQAERRLLERSDDDDEIRRTLLLAQRTAVTTVDEAKATAAEIVADAERVATERAASAEERLAGLEAELAERGGRELRELAERRAGLEQEIETLARFAETHRLAMRAELTRLLDELDAPNPALVQAEAPAVSALPELPPLVLPPPPAFNAEPLAPRPPTDAEVAQAREDLVGALRRAGVEDFLVAAQAHLDAEPMPVAQPEPEPEPEPTEEEPPEVVAPELYDDDQQADPAIDAGEPTALFDALVEDDEFDDVPAPVTPAEPEPEPEPESEPIPMPEPEPAPVQYDDDDPFLTELRRAVTDTEPLGPRDHEGPPAGHHDDEHLPQGRFRLRRGR